MRPLFWLAVTAFTMSTGSGAQQAAPNREQQPKPAKAETSRPTPKSARMLADPPSKAPAAAAKTREARKPVPIPEEPKP